jgi:hypothetical protein
MATLTVEVNIYNASAILRIAEALNGKSPEFYYDHVELIKAVHQLIDMAEMRHPDTLKMIEEEIGKDNATYKLVETLQI